VTQKSGFNTLKIKELNGAKGLMSSAPTGGLVIINTARAVLPNVTVVVGRFHFFSYLNKAVDNPRKSLRREFKDQDDLKHLKWALLKYAEGWTPDQKKKRDYAFLLAPQLKLIYNHKEKFRALFNQKNRSKSG
jgi:transposase